VRSPEFKPAKKKKKTEFLLDMAAYACNPSIQEAEARESQD
jgi:hypothetical protein